MKIILFTLVLFSTATFAQKLKIKKAYAFSQPLSIGTSPLDESNQLSNHYFALLELKSTDIIQIPATWINGISYNVTITLKSSKVSVDPPASDNKIVITSSPGYKLFSLDLSRDDQQKKIPASYRKMKAGTVLVELIYNKKVYYYLIPEIVQLKTDVSKS